MSGTDTLIASAAGQNQRERRILRLHGAWRISVAVTIAAGLFHLINLVGLTRSDVGTLLLTPFRVAFIISWCLLLARFVAERRRPRLDYSDIMVAGVAALFFFRGLFDLSTFPTVVNWLLTGAGLYYLIKFGIRDKRDVRLVLITTLSATLVICIYGLVEYFFKANPLFDATQIDVIGPDTRIRASNQFYRIRSLVGHPGFVGSIMVGSVPLALLILWRRGFWMTGYLLLAGAVWFLTFSRGSWLLGSVVLLPICFRARRWVTSNWKVIVPITLIPAALLAFDWWDRDQASIMLGSKMQESGLQLLSGPGDVNGQYEVMSGEADGIRPVNNYLYFGIDPQFWQEQHEPATVVLIYFDKGYGALRIDYDSWDNGFVTNGYGVYKNTVIINKTNSGQWTSAAFYLEDPRFAGRENMGASFRVVEEDNTFVLERVILQRGKLTLPSVVEYQWLSRSGSIYTRADLFPFAWSVLKDNPFGVGLYDSPGTDHHAVDSLPLTWMMEFGWLGLALLLGLVFLLVVEAVRAAREPRSMAAILLMVLVVVMLHGGHLMILYDKPNLVLVAVVGAVYSAVRPWRKGGPAVAVSNEDCML